MDVEDPVSRLQKFRQAGGVLELKIHQRSKGRVMVYIRWTPEEGRYEVLLIGKKNTQKRACRFLAGHLTTNYASLQMVALTSIEPVS
ncbi:MAG: hypothetical protein NZO16_02785 [Deltaproteobacteria bacterium]|nr:hypothetical protein [Deltaproteobacteria bacterium]